MAAKKDYFTVLTAVLEFHGTEKQAQKAAVKASKDYRTKAEMEAYLTRKLSDLVSL